jgi:hypothetical protein
MRDKKKQEALLAYALVMAVTAPDHRANEALDVAHQFANGLSSKAVARAKQSARATLLTIRAAEQTRA